MELLPSFKDIILISFIEKGQCQIVYIGEF